MKGDFGVEGGGDGLWGGGSWAGPRQVEGWKGRTQSWSAWMRGDDRNSGRMTGGALLEWS
jgi:hypothetical protein